MVHFSTPYICNKNQLNLEHRIFTFPFSEEDLIQLQEIFVTPGIHTIKMKNVEQARQIIEIILNSLNYYHTIGALTFIEKLPTHIWDIIGHVTFDKQMNYNLIDDLEIFFANYSCFDFIWVEATKTMQNVCKLSALQKIFDVYHAQERMPILFIVYEEE
ncbi:MAG: hypothetical protein ACXWL2_02120 [Candidatus Chromulinivorax sp.]